MHDETRIRERADAIWEREGRPEGRHMEHWAEAERQLAAEAAAQTAPEIAFGPDAGLRTPSSGSERHLHEAAERLRVAERHGIVEPASPEIGGEAGRAIPG